MFFASSIPLDLTGASSDLVEGIIVAGQAGLVILIALYGVRLVVRAFKEVGSDHIEPMTSEEIEEEWHAAGHYGPFGPDLTDPNDERNYGYDVYLSDEVDPDEVDSDDVGDEDSLDEPEEASEQCPHCGSSDIVRFVHHPDGDMGCGECGEIWER